MSGIIGIAAIPRPHRVSGLYDVGYPTILPVYRIITRGHVKSFLGARCPRYSPHAKCLTADVGGPALPSLTVSNTQFTPGCFDEL